MSNNNTVDEILIQAFTGFKVDQCTIELLSRTTRTYTYKRARSQLEKLIQRERLLAAIDQLNADFSAGGLRKDFYDETLTDYKKQLEELNKDE